VSGKVRARRVIASCSFCLRDNTEVETLIAGPGVYICDECVKSCVEILETKPALMKRIAPWEREQSDEALLELLPRVAAARALVDEALAEWIGRARRQGISWERIGGVLGMTRQAAWDRFSHAD